MTTELLQNKYICISYKSKPQIKDLTRIFHVLIKNRIKNTGLQNYVRLLVGRSIFGQHKDRQQHLFTTNVRKKQSFNINNSKR